MPALVAGIHVLIASAVQGVDGRVKPGHDARTVCSSIHPGLAGVLADFFGRFGAIRTPANCGLSAQCETTVMPSNIVGVERIEGADGRLLV